MMKAVTLQSFGSPEVMTITEVSKPTLNKHELLIKVFVAAINRADLLQRQGKYPPPKEASSILGLEIAGEVVSIGDSVTHFKMGDRVCGLVSGGGYSEFCVLDSGSAIKIPDAWDYVYAAAVPEAGITANETLFTLGQLKPEEILLLHAAASGVGTMALQMAKYHNAKVIAVVGSDLKVNETLKLGADVSINYKTTDWLAQVKDLTKETGVDVIEDFMGAEYLSAHLSLLNPEGRLIMVAFMRGFEVNCDLRPILQKMLQIKGFILRMRTVQEKSAMTQRFIEKWLPVFIRGDIKPIIDTVFDFKDVQKAHEYVAENKNIGKVLLRW
jgi:putative PIG3 family NAD(P)H quinone oxidoreductase